MPGNEDWIDRFVAHLEILGEREVWEAHPVPCRRCILISCLGLRKVDGLRMLVT